MTGLEIAALSGGVGTLFSSLSNGFQGDFYKHLNASDIGNQFDQGGYVGKLGERSEELMNPSSNYNVGVRDSLKQQTNDQVFAQNLLNRRNMAASGMIGQSGVLQQLQSQNQNQAYNNMVAQTRAGISANLDRSNTLLNQAAQFDLAKGEAMASAYGQNITNQNNLAAARAGNLTSTLGGIASAGVMMMSDKRKKENIKKVGQAKTKSGKSVNLYSYNFKGSKKKNVGVIAQEIQKSHPKAVKKQKNGMLMVNYKELF